MCDWGISYSHCLDSIEPGKYTTTEGKSNKPKLYFLRRFILLFYYFDLLNNSCNDFIWVPRTGPGSPEVWHRPDGSREAPSFHSPPDSTDCLRSLGNVYSWG